MIPAFAPIPISNHMSSPQPIVSVEVLVDKIKLTSTEIEAWKTVLWF
jgi:hypothetical protein